MNSAVDGELLKLNQRLLDSIASGDWETYQGLCDPLLTAFEPETRGYLIQGIDFHHFYFQLNKNTNYTNTSMSCPSVKIIGEMQDVAVLTYVKIVQRLDDAGNPYTKTATETRIWHKKKSGQWLHVHFHRSR